MSDIVISLTDIQKLKEELNTLNDEYLKLYEKMEDLKKEKEYFESLYMCKFGALIFLRFKNEIKYRWLKKKLALIVKSKNKGEEINIEEIESVLEKELEEFYRNLDELRNNLKSSQEFLELPTLTEEEVKKVKEIFRNLAKILHPDVNKNLNEEMMELWLKVKEAYENNDLMTLIILQGIVKHNEIKEDIKVTSIEENIVVLKKKINELKNFIDEEENSFPLNIKELIDNNQYIKDKKQDITNDIHEYEIMITQVEKSICEVLKEQSYG
ncbi:hypothetical protein [Clostridium sp.]|uniref:hypothetical protein n=1 Tax=Clostridium sp. TaxID=1506 RepID=UPI003217079E